MCLISVTKINAQQSGFGRVEPKTMQYYSPKSCHLAALLDFQLILYRQLPRPLDKKRIGATRPTI
jgi:hypothetical protein